MKSIVATLLFGALINPASVLAQASLTVQEVSVGNKLETWSSVVLGQPAPEAGLDITLRSKDPAKLLLSKSPDQQGASTLELHLKPGMRQTPEFWVQALDGSGKAEYTAEAPGYTSGVGTVNLKPSAIVIMGPMKAPRFTTTVKGAPTSVTLMAARLEESLDFAEEQAIAGGFTIEPEITNSTASVATLDSKPEAMKGGMSSQVVRLRPLKEGEASFSIAAAPGFSSSKQYASLAINVRKPGLAVSEQIYIGQNLQVAGVLSLGEAAPEGGLKVTLTSEDPQRLLLSASGTVVGSKTITVAIPAGATSGSYYLQALGDKGTVTYTASADGFQSRTGTIGLSPSGILLTPIAQGPPDEAHVLRKEAPDAVHRFPASLAHPVKSVLVAWTAQLDPVTHRGADITVQPLRAGLTLTIPVTNSNPAITRLAASSVHIDGGSDNGSVEFTPVEQGSAEIDIGTPAGFIQAANATKVIVVVSQ